MAAKEFRINNLARRELHAEWIALLYTRCGVQTRSRQRPSRLVARSRNNPLIGCFSSLWNSVKSFERTAQQVPTGGPTLTDFHFPSSRSSLSDDPTRKNTKEAVVESRYELRKTLENGKRNGVIICRAFRSEYYRERIRRRERVNEIFRRETPRIGGAT